MLRRGGGQLRGRSVGPEPSESGEPAAPAPPELQRYEEQQVGARAQVISSD
jgi:hypothetical protein